MFLTKNVNIWFQEKRILKRAPSSIPKFFPKHEVARFFAIIPRRNLRDRVLFDLMYRYGLRRGEAAQLCRDDVDLRDRTITINRLKRSRSGVYPLYPDSEFLLRRYLKPLPESQIYLFAGRRAGTHLSATTIYYTCRKYARKAGLSRSNPHAFRHSCGVHAADARLDLLDIADLLGHKSINTAIRYTAVSSARRDDNHRRIIESEAFAATAQTIRGRRRGTRKDARLSGPARF
jgi:integrase